MFAEELPDALPALRRRLRSVHGPVAREEGMAGVLEHVEGEVLARGAQRRRELFDVLGRRMLVLGAEQTEQRARQRPDVVHDRPVIESPSDSGTGSTAKPP